MAELIALLTKLGEIDWAKVPVFTLFVLFIGALYKGVLVWGKEHRRVEKERDFYRDITHRLTGVSRLQAEVLRAKERQELARISDLNQALLESEEPSGQQENDT